MSAASVPIAADDGPGRPNVLAYPSPTTSRFMVFLAALLTAGAFVGGWVHTQVLGQQWVSTVARCEQQSQQSSPTASLIAGLEANAAQERCRASVERRRAAFAIGGALSAGVAGMIILFLVPNILERRRRLSAFPPALAPAVARADELTRGLRLRRTPTLMLGPSALHDAFSYGRPGAYRVAVPPAAAVRWRDERLFDPLIGHEFAHIEHHDVALAWLARSVWYVVAPLLALPIVVDVIRGDLSLVPDYLWRAALLAVTVQIASSALLRSREYDADLRAAQTGIGLGRMVELVTRAADSGSLPRWRAALAKHPRAADRVRALEQPHTTARVRFADGVTAGFLAGVSIPLVVWVVTTLLIGSGHTDDALTVAAALSGSLLAGSVGLGLCRSALMNRVGGAVASLWSPAIGVGIGLALGQAASLAQAGVGVASLRPLTWLPIVAVVGTCVTVLAGSVGEVLADAAPATHGARTSSWLGLIVMALLFSAALWFGTAIQTPLMLGWTGVEAWLVTALRSMLVLGAVGGLGAVLAWWAWERRVPRQTPVWLLERGSPGRWSSGGRIDLARAVRAGSITGAVAVVVLVVYRRAEGTATPATKLELFYLMVWLAAAAAFCAAAAVAWARRPRGAALGALAGLLACLVTVIGWLVHNTVQSGLPTWTFVSDVVRQAPALAFPMMLLAAPVMLLPALPVREAGKARCFQVGVGPWVPATVLVVASAALLIVARASLPPFGTSTGEPRNPPAASQVSATVEELLYVQAFAPRVVVRFESVERAVARIDANTTAGGPERARLIATTVLPSLGTLLRDAVAYRSVAPPVVAAQAKCIAALRTFQHAFRSFAAGFASDHIVTVSNARTELATARSDWLAWLRQVAALSTKAAHASG